MDKDLRKLNRNELVELVYQFRVELDRSQEENRLLQQRVERAEDAVRENDAAGRQQIQCLTDAMQEQLERLKSAMEGSDHQRMLELEKENETLRKRLEARALILGEAGNIAEATLNLHALFEQAQATADAYLENVKHSSASAEEILTQAREQAEALTREAERNAQDRINAAEKAVSDKWLLFQQRCEELIHSSEVLRQIMEK